jgi:hypothetical protein
MATLARQLLELVYLLLPAYVANMAASLAKSWPGWNRPISRRWLGDHKTIVGVLLGVAAGVLTSSLQARVWWFPHRLEPSSWVVAGCAQSIGAMSGDTVKSFLKRRIELLLDCPAFPADQLDFILGAMVLGRPWLPMRLLEVALILAFTFIAHILVNHIAFGLQIRDAKW